MISWPEIITEQLWPYVLQLAVDLHNNTPGPSGLTPTEIFTGIKNRNRFPDFHPFGCPIFILDLSLQQCHKIPRWKTCSRVRVYLGFSPEHASSIPLVLSTTTGLVSPQFHVVFDNYFTTTDSLKTNILPSNWSNLLTTSSSKFVDDDFKPTNFTDTSWFHDPTSSDHLPSPLNVPDEQFSPSQREPDTTFQKEATDSGTHPQPGWNSNQHYETRFCKKHLGNTCFLEDSSDDVSFDENLYSAFISMQDSHPIHSGTELSFLEHFSCAAQSNPDVLHFGSMLHDRDRIHFEADMVREVNDLIHSDTIEVTSFLCTCWPKNSAGASAANELLTGPF
jgi:hypothetical protein